MMYVFVEGNRDVLFVDNILSNILKINYYNYHVISYAKKNKTYIKKFLISIESMDNSDYIFIADQDGNLQKKQKIIKQYPYLDEKKIFISIFEIESWIIAGMSEKLRKKYNIKDFVNTETFTKENFNSIKPSELHVNEFIAYIFSEYDFQKAINRNISFKELYNYLITKKAS